jgi:hypothetical protein
MVSTITAPVLSRRDLTALHDHGAAMLERLIAGGKRGHRWVSSDPSRQRDLPNDATAMTLCGGAVLLIEGRRPHAGEGHDSWNSADLVGERGDFVRC